MNPQSDCLGWCIVALVAFIWLFTTVRFQMPPKIACIIWRKLTLVAFFHNHRSFFIDNIFTKICILKSLIHHQHETRKRKKTACFTNSTRQLSAEHWFFSSQISLMLDFYWKNESEKNDIWQFLSCHQEHFHIHIVKGAENPCRYSSRIQIPMYPQRAPKEREYNFIEILFSARSPFQLLARPADRVGGRPFNAHIFPSTLPPAESAEQTALGTKMKNFTT